MFTHIRKNWKIKIVLPVIIAIVLLTTTAWHISTDSAPKMAIDKTLHKPTATTVTPTMTPVVNTALEDLITKAANSIFNTAVSSTKGITWANEENNNGQGAEYDTDTDVGSAGIIREFIALASETTDPILKQKYLAEAKAAGDYLLAVAIPDPRSGGIRMPDYAGPNDTSDTSYTSEDDGAVGDAEVLIQLGTATGNTTYIQSAIKLLKWEIKQGTYSTDINGVTCAPNTCMVFPWANDDPTRYNGIGMGEAGIMYAMAQFSEKLPDGTTYMQVAKSIASYLEIEMHNDSCGSGYTLPQPIAETGICGQDGDTEYDTGYVSGQAGNAFAFLYMYNVTKDIQYLKDAEVLLGWLTVHSSTENFSATEKARYWEIAFDPQGGDSTLQATGVEEGSAGILSVFMEAYNVMKANNISGGEAYLQTAKEGGNWLIKNAITMPDSGYAWYEDANDTTSPMHTGLDNGAAGIGMVLHGLAIVTNDKAYDKYATGAMQWITNIAHSDSKDGVYWYESYTMKNNKLIPGNITKDASWHWGAAGITAFLEWMNGKGVYMPGEQPAIITVLPTAVRYTMQ